MLRLDQYIAQINADTTFKSKIEKVNLLLTNHETKDSVTESDAQLKQQRRNVNYDLIDMLLIDLRKYLASNVLHWNTKMNEFFKNKFDEGGENGAGTGSQVTVPIDIPKAYPNSNTLVVPITNKQALYGLGSSSKDDEYLLGKFLIY